MRNLVTIQKISDIVPIEGADKVETARVLGWNIVVKKDEHKAGDLAVYFEIDSYLPIEDSRFEFLSTSSLRKSPDQSRETGYRIKTMKLRGVISQGLLMSTGLFEELNGRGLYEGMDLTEELNVVKWDPPEIAQGNIVGKPGKPYGIPTTDETRLQSAPEQVEEFVGKPYYITVKCDGTSCSMYKYNDSYGVTTRSMDLMTPSDASTDNAYTKMYRKLELYKKLNSNIVIQGELCGPNIQKNRMRLGEYHWYVFDAYDLDSHTYYGYRKLKELCDALELEMVPLLEEGDSYPKEYNLEELLSKAVCKYPNGSQAEGIVVRLQDVHPKRRSFKVINNQYLLKEKE